MSLPPPSSLERFRTLVAERFGLAFDSTKMSFLAELLEQRRRVHRAASAAEYLDGIARAPAELDALVERLTVGETYFFRSPDQLQVLAEVVLPGREGARSLRVLSAGCASGEEPYSIAIALREALPELASWRINIEAVDLNPAALATAAAACYSSWSLRESPPELRERYFREEARGRFRLDDGIRSMVSFARRNLAGEVPELSRIGWFDVIFCRNLIMYLAPEVARGLLERLARAIVPGGHLFLGHAETLRGLSQAFHLRHTHRTFYYQRRALGEAEADAAPPELAAPAPGPNLDWMRVIQQAASQIDRLAASPPRPPAPEARVAPAGPAIDLDSLLLRAVLLTNQGQSEAAEAACLELLSRDELNAGAHYLLALCREHAKDRPAAVDHDQYALYLDPGFAMARLHLGLMARRAGDLEAARRELGEALLLLEREDAARIFLLGGGFTREVLCALCRAELRACGGRT